MCARPSSCGSLSSARCAVICTLRSLSSRLKPRRGVKALHAASAKHIESRVVRTMVLRMSGFPISKHFECGALPVTARRAGIAVERYHIEPARHRSELRMRLQETLRGAHEFFALGGADRSRAAAETCVAPVAYFHEHQRVAVAHHEVEFTETGAVVGFDTFQARAFQTIQRALLEAGADRNGGHGSVGAGISAGCVSSPAATGRATPPWNSTQIGVRCTWPKASIVSCPEAPGT